MITLTRTVRILLVDDSEGFRSRVASILQNRPELKIVGTASNGDEAVQTAEELRPEMILVDLGLPGINGIEAARQILAVLPKCKVLFVTQNESPVIAREAIRLGAHGFLVKTDCSRELLLGIEAVIAGSQFLSSRIAKRMGLASLQGVSWRIERQEHVNGNPPTFGQTQ